MAAALKAAIDEGWSVIRTGLVMATSFLPFGTFYVDAKWLRVSRHGAVLRASRTMPGVSNSASTMGLGLSGR
jgi:hypothetical protein